MNPLDMLAGAAELGTPDYFLREREKLKRLERKLAALINMLQEKGLLDHDEAVRLRTDAQG